MATSSGSASVASYDPAAQVVLEGGGKRLAIPAERLAKAGVQMNADGPYLVFRLNDADSAAMAALTGTLIGQPLSVSICGEVLAAPVVREQVSGAGIVPVGDLPNAFALSAALNGVAPCPEKD